MGVHLHDHWTSDCLSDLNALIPEGMTLARPETACFCLCALTLVISVAWTTFYGSLVEHSRRSVTNWTLRRPHNQTAWVTTAGNKPWKLNSHTNTQTQGEHNNPLPEVAQLSSFIDEEHEKIIANVQEFLQFAVIGHAKTGTSFLLRRWLGNHPQIIMPSKETHQTIESKLHQGAIELVKLMANIHQHIPAHNNHTHHDESQRNVLRRGIKNPAIVHRAVALANLQVYFPQTKLIVGLRHPVWWFQSFYNFLHRQQVTVPPPHKLIGSCTILRNFCTNLAQFHYNLALMGKTDLGNDRETKWFGERQPPRDLLHLSNPVFVYEISQLHDAPAHELQEFALDMQDFLELEEPLRPLTDFAPEPSHHNYSVLHICDGQYQGLRNMLVDIGRNASHWIREYFLPLTTDVMVSSPDSFVHYLRKWEYDPCVK